MLKKVKKGFTIVELVIVIGVIGILSAILIPTFANLTSKAETAAKQSDLANVYAEYAADAADGYIGDDITKPLKFYAQDKVNLAKGGKYYSYVDGKWNAEGAAAATTGYTQIAGVEYSGYTVYANQAA